MTENQKKIIKKMQWIAYPVALLLFIDFIIKFLNPSSSEANQNSNQLFELLDKTFMITVFVIVSVAVIALMQQFFTKEIIKSKKTQEAATARLLMKIEIPNQLAGNLVFFVVALGFSVLVNMMLFAPQTIFEQEQMNGFGIGEKIAFGFFYVIAHFLVIVFGLRLLKGMPPVFIATEKGFCYEPAGISTGWVLWNDITEVRESTVLQGSTTYSGPRLLPVLGIKLINPEAYNAAAYAPLLQRVVKMGQQFNNYQTEGVGDILLNPTDFGKNYETVLALFKEKSKSSFSYHSESN